MSSIRSVIIGLGQIGAGYDAELDSARYAYSHARALEQHSNFSLMAGVDTQSANRDRFSKLYNVAAYERYNGIAFDEAPALVIVAVPTEFHWQVVQEVIKVAAPKVILCEKPLSFDAKEARQIVQLCNEHQVQLFVNYFRRSEPAVLQINERIQNGAIAAPLKAVVWYSKGFLHNGSHFFNLLEFWLGAFIQGRPINHLTTTANGDVEGDLQIQFKRGSVVFLSANENNFSHTTIEIIAANGRLRYDLGGRQIIWQEAIQSSRLAGYRFLSEEVEVIETGMDRYQWHVADQLAREIRNEKTSLCDGQTALLTLENMLKIASIENE